MRRRRGSSNSPKNVSSRFPARVPRKETVDGTSQAGRLGGELCGSFIREQLAEHRDDRARHAPACTRWGNRHGEMAQGRGRWIGGVSGIDLIVLTPVGEFSSAVLLN